MWTVAVNGLTLGTRQLMEDDKVVEAIIDTSAALMQFPDEIYEQAVTMFADVKDYASSNFTCDNGLCVANISCSDMKVKPSLFFKFQMVNSSEADVWWELPHDSLTRDYKDPGNQMCMFRFMKGSQMVIGAPFVENFYLLLARQF